MHSVDVRLEIPRQPSRPPRRPERRRGHRNPQRDGRRQDHIRAAASRQPAHNAHQHDRKADRVQHVDAEQIGPGRPRPAQREFLHAKQQRQPENFGAAPDRLRGDLIRGNSLPPHFVRDQRHGNAGKKQEQRRREHPAEPRPAIKGRVARRRAQPRVVAMHLEHHQAGEAAQPVDVAETLSFQCAHQIGTQQNPRGADANQVFPGFCARSSKIPFLAATPDRGK